MLLSETSLAYRNVAGDVSEILDDAVHRTHTSSSSLLLRVSLPIFVTIALTSRCKLLPPDECAELANLIGMTCPRFY